LGLTLSLHVHEGCELIKRLLQADLGSTGFAWRTSASPKRVAEPSIANSSVNPQPLRWKWVRHRRRTGTSRPAL